MSPYQLGRKKNRFNYRRQKQEHSHLISWLTFIIARRTKLSKINSSPGVHSYQKLLELGGVSARGFTYTDSDGDVCEASEQGPRGPVRPRGFRQRHQNEETESTADDEHEEHSPRRNGH